MKTKLACIAMIVFGCKVTLAQKSNIYRVLSKYETCDTASFIRTQYSKQPEKQIMTSSTFAMTLCRKGKGAVWYAYDIQTLDTGLHFLSFFNAKQRAIYLADSSDVYQEVRSYVFDPYVAPPYIWDIYYFPWDLRFILTIYKKRKKFNDFNIYTSLYGKYKIKLYVNTKNNLIEKIVHLRSDGSYDSVIYHYNYIKSQDTVYQNPIPSNRYFPVNNKNSNISVERGKALAKQDEWARRTIFKDSVLSKIIDGNHSYYLIDFWHLSCQPCRYNLQIIDTAFKQMKNTEVVLINVNDNDSEAKNYLNKNSYNFRNICDYSHDIEEFFKPTAYPTTILLDKKGNIIWRHDGIAKDIGNQIRLAIQSNSTPE